MRRFMIAGVSALALSATGALADGLGETGEILQEGTLGAAYIHQDAESANAFITQGIGSAEDTAAIAQSEYGSGGSSATITQNTFSGGYGNVAGIVQTNLESGSMTGEINQDGSMNTAGIRQRDVDTSALVDQDGLENKAMIKQGDVPPEFAELEADAGNGTTTIDFSGALNYEGTSGGIFADGDQGPAHNSIASVSQYGERNKGAILQLGENQDGSIFQDGDDNSARIQQTYELNTALVEQFGMFNEAEVLQTGSDNLADVLQDGYANVAAIMQYDESGDSASVYQTGEGHLGMVMQSADHVVSVAVIDQSGSYNTGMISQ